jgi:hypothetical protein
MPLSGYGLLDFAGEPLAAELDPFIGEAAGVALATRM